MSRIAQHKHLETGSGTMTGPLDPAHCLNPSTTYSRSIAKEAELLNSEAKHVHAMQLSVHIGAHAGHGPGPVG